MGEAALHAAMTGMMTAKGLSDEAKDFCLALVRVDPKDRPPMSLVASHPFFAPEHARDGLSADAIKIILKSQEAA